MNEIGMVDTDHSTTLAVQPQTTPAERFTLNCLRMGYSPTMTEVRLLIGRNAFRDTFNGTDALLTPARVIPDRLGIDTTVRDQVIANLREWGEAIGSPEAELASHLVTDLLQRVDAFAAGPTELQTLTTSARDIRDGLCEGGRDVSDVAVRTVLAYQEQQLRKSSWHTRFSRGGLAARADFSKARKISGQTADEMLRDDLDRVTGDCMVAFLQAGEHPYVNKGVVSALGNLYQFASLDRYASAGVISGALTKADQALSPIRADLLRIVNSKIGLPPRPK